MSVVPQSHLVNRAIECMAHPIDQKRIRSEGHVFFQQLELIEVKDDDDVLEAVKRKFQADANRQAWIRDGIVEKDDLVEYEERLKDFNKLHSEREDEPKETEGDKKKFGRNTYRLCRLEGLKHPSQPNCRTMVMARGCFMRLLINLL